MIVPNNKKLAEFTLYFMAFFGEMGCATTTAYKQLTYLFAVQSYSSVMSQIRCSTNNFSLVLVHG